MASELSKNGRRRPRQARSRATWEAIVEAAAQILERRGPAGFNTNEVAERAGVSIGTLYQYFPDKHAILAAAARRELGDATPMPKRQRALIEALIALVETLGRLGGGAGAASPVPRSAAPATAPVRRRRDDGWRRAADLVRETLAELLLPEPVLRPIRIRRICR